MATPVDSLLAAPDHSAVANSVVGRYLLEIYGFHREVVDQHWVAFGVEVCVDGPLPPGCPP